MKFNLRFYRHENESSGNFLKFCKMDKYVSKHPENQQNGAQNFLKSGNFLKILMPGFYHGRSQGIMGNT